MLTLDAWRLYYQHEASNSLARNDGDGDMSNLVVTTVCCEELHSGIAVNARVDALSKDNKALSISVGNHTVTFAFISDDQLRSIQRAIQDELHSRSAAPMCEPADADVADALPAVGTRLYLFADPAVQGVVVADVKEGVMVYVERDAHVSYNPQKWGVVR